MTLNFTPTATASKTIGEVPLERVIETARLLADCGGPSLPHHIQDVSDFPITGPDVIRMTSEAKAHSEGTILMSSGGTTGTPKLTFVPYEQSIGRITDAWKPLTSENVMLNLYNPGRLWGSHYYMLALTQKVNCRMVPMGALAPEEVETYLPAIEAAGVDTLAGTPTAVHDFAMGAKAIGAQLPVTKIMWVGEPWNLKKKQEVEEVFPGVEFWGNYGSIETYVIASNTPQCPNEIFHLHPDQLLELDDEGALLTRVGDGWTVPTLRYRLGDTLVATQCPCGRPNAFMVKGRSDSGFKFGGTLFDSTEILLHLRDQEGVDEAQIMIIGSKAQAAAQRLVVKYVGSAAPDTVLQQITGQFVDIDVRNKDGQLMMSTETLPALERNPRTHKISAVTWTD